MIPELPKHLPLGIGVMEVSEEDFLETLTSLLAENEPEIETEELDGAAAQDAEEDLDGLFDDDDDEEEYDEGLEEDEGSGAAQQGTSTLFGDIKDLEGEDEEEGQDEEERSSEPSSNVSGEANDELMNKSKEDLAAELQRMQEQMQRLQQQLEATQAAAATPGDGAPPKPKPSAQPEKPAAPTGRTAPPAVPPVPLKNKKRTAHPPKRSPKEDIENNTVGQSDSCSQPVRANRKLNSKPQPPLPQATPPVQKAPPRPPAPHDAAVEKFSGLRLRKPRVSSVEMERKMADRRLIRLSQLPDRLAREKLEDSDWVTFAVVVSKATPQSNSSGKTFSIWKLNDLHDLEVYVSLFLFGEVHKEHWKTHPGTVIGVLNPSPMKPKDGSDGVCLSVDHAQKILLMGEALDFGTCKANKKNGQLCSQLVNLHECQYCQYHVKAQYKKMSAKRAELQSCFSGKVPGKAQAGRGRGGASLKERLCHTGFHYGGVSSAACAASLTASQPKKPSQTTLSSLFVRGADQIVSQAKGIAMQAGQVSGCTDDFRGLLSLPTPGALNLKRHLSHARPSGSASVEVQYISASQLLKQQKQRMLDSRKMRAEEIERRRAEEIEKRILQNFGKAGADAPHTPTLGRGLAEGEDVLFFFDRTPPPPPPSHSLPAAKLAALKKLRQKGGAIAKEDPNAVKRKRPNSADVAAKLESSLQSPPGDEAGAEPEEPALKKRREQLAYLQSDEFQKILNAKSRHEGVLQAAEIQMQEQYFDPLVKKEQMEEKMRNIREMKCRAVTCKTCKYTYFKPLDQCVEKKHDYHWHDAVKRFFKCPCGQRAIALDRLPHKHCSNCGLFKWERDGMLKEKSGPKIAGELLLPRGEEQPKFLSSMK
ncbi:protein MCM10 homolog isoform X2 [Anguilla rostrata]|uniref:protein MCM10 homolog isoform X2 n=1 Tax=Anguilla rostrata TaxID=7938 RepID=UPI0030D126F7